MRRTPLLLLSTLLLLATLVFAWPEPPAPGMPTPTPRANGAETVARGGPEQGDAEPQPVAASGPEQETAARRAVATPPSATIPLRVVEFGTGAPVPGATVRFAPRIDWLALDERLGRAVPDLALRDRETALEHVGRETTTDAEGRCDVVLAQGEVTEIVARRGELYGEVQVAPDTTGEVVVVVRPDRTLRILVVDHGSRPAAGAHVRIRMPPGNPTPLVGAGSPLPLGTTDGSGRCEYRHAQRLTEGTAVGTAWELEAAVPGATSAPVPVDPAAPPPEVVLGLPPTGSVLVRVLEADGSPIDPTAFARPTIVLTTHAERPLQPERAIPLQQELRHEVPIGQDGTAVIEHVALDRFLIAWCMLADEPAQFAGPTLAQRHVEATLRLPAPAALLTGRLLDPAGQPLRDRTFRCTLRHGRGSASSAERTGPDGSFRVRVHDEVGIEVAVAFAEPGAVGETATMATELPPRTIQAGRNELGDVRLDAFRVLLAGRVVRGEGIGDGMVTFYVHRRDGAGWRRDAELCDGVRQVERDRFEVHGALPDGTALRLEVSRGEWLPVAPIECAVGDRDVAIELRAAGRVTAQFRVDDGTELDRLEFRLQRTEPPPAADPRARRREHREVALPHQDDSMQWRCRWVGLEPGTYRLTVACPGSDAPLARLDGLRVRGGDCDDPRLAAIDLRGSMRRIRVRAVDADGEEIRDAAAFAMPVATGTTWAGASLATGTAELWTTGPVDVLVTAPGHRTARAAGVVDEATVRLERADAAWIAVRLPFALPDDVSIALRAIPLAHGDEAQIQLGTGSRSLAALFGDLVPVGADGVATVPVRLPGPYRFVAVVGGRRYVHRTEPSRLDLPADGGSFALTLDAAALQQALESK